MLRNQSTLPLERIRTSPESVFHPLKTAKSMCHRANTLVNNIMDLLPDMSARNSETLEFGIWYMADEAILDLVLQNTQNHMENSGLMRSVCDVLPLLGLRTRVTLKEQIVRRIRERGHPFQTSKCWRGLCEYAERCTTMKCLATWQRPPAPLDNPQPLLE